MGPTPPSHVSAPRVLWRRVSGSVFSLFVGFFLATKFDVTTRPDALKLAPLLSARLRFSSENHGSLADSSVMGVAAAINQDTVSSLVNKSVWPTRMHSDVSRLEADVVTSLTASCCEKYLVWRCRYQDHCSGLGDRIAGMTGAALFAILTGRQLRLEFDGLDAIMEPNVYNWTYDPDELEVSPHDQHSLKIGVPKGERGAQSHIIPFNISDDLAVYQTYNSFIMEILETGSALENYRVVFFHSNRGPKLKWIHHARRKFGWGLPEHTTSWQFKKKFYSAVFDGLFRPKPSLLQYPISIQKRTWELHDVLTQTSGTPTISFHMRFGDHRIANCSACSCNTTAWSEEQIMDRVRCIQSLFSSDPNHKSKGRVRYKTVLLFSDVPCELDTFRRRLRHIFGDGLRVATVSHQGAVSQVDGRFVHSQEDRLHALVAGFVDILIMRTTDLIMTPSSTPGTHFVGSGFSVGAHMISSNPGQRLYIHDTCEEVQSCANRFC